VADDLQEELDAFGGLSAGPPLVAPDPVNQPMIRHMVEALGDTNPIYVDADAARSVGHPDVVAPPTMMQTWSMPGIRGPRRAGEGGTGRDVALNLINLLDLLDAAGFTSVVATNCEQQYLRYLAIGDHITVTRMIESISAQKRTALGVGHFVTTRDEYRDQNGDLVGNHWYRILRFKPEARPARNPAAAEDPLTHPSGSDLPVLEIPITRTLIVATAIASRDYEDVHHDPLLAEERGSPDIFMNILTSNGFVGRFVTDWAGPAARLKQVAIRLRTPNYPGDAMRMTGSITAVDGDEITVEVVGANSRGTHVTGTVVLTQGSAIPNV
jgi:acyl dehydratase